MSSLCSNRRRSRDPSREYRLTSRSQSPRDCLSPKTESLEAPKILPSSACARRLISMRSPRTRRRSPWTTLRTAHHHFLSMHGRSVPPTARGRSSIPRFPRHRQLIRRRLKFHSPCRQSEAARHPCAHFPRSRRRRQRVETPHPGFYARRRDQDRRQRAVGRLRFRPRRTRTTTPPPRRRPRRHPERRSQDAKTLSGASSRVTARQLVSLREPPARRHSSSHRSRHPSRRSPPRLRSRVCREARL